MQPKPSPLLLNFLDHVYYQGGKGGGRKHGGHLRQLYTEFYFIIRVLKLRHLTKQGQEK